MLEPLGVAIHAMDLAKPQNEETVAVVGCGPIGIQLIQLAKIKGASRVIAIEPLVYRRDAAIAAGATEALPHVDALTETTSGRGVDLVLEATNAPEGLSHACRAARIGGRLVVVGIPDGNAYTEMAADVMRRKGLTMMMSRRPHPHPNSLIAP